MTSWQSLKHQAFFGCSIVYGHGTLECDRGNSRRTVFWYLGRWQDGFRSCKVTSNSILTQKMVNMRIFVGSFVFRWNFNTHGNNNKIFRICWNTRKPEMIGCCTSDFIRKIPWFGMKICYSSKRHEPWTKCASSLRPNWNGLDEVLLGENVCLISLEIRPYVLKCGGH